METGRDFYHKEIDPNRLIGAVVLDSNPNGAAPILKALNLGGASIHGWKGSREEVGAFLTLGQMVMNPNGFVLQVTK